MAKLTRTQKYAEYRDKISQDREESLRTEELTPFEDQLQSLESQFNRESDTDLSRGLDKLAKEEKQTSFNNQTEDVRKAQEDSMKSLDDILASMMGESFQTPVVEKKEPVRSDTSKENNISSQSGLQPTSTMRIISNEVNEFLDIIDDNKEEEPKQTYTQPINNTQNANNNFVDNALKDVDEYNSNKGRATLDNLSNNIIEEIRHPEQVSEKTDAHRDDDFSNTVTLEIEKVLQEIRTQAPEEEQSQKKVQKVFKQAEVKEETFEHPVLAKTKEEPVVEIKNINETFSNNFNDANVLDDTIPFVVDRNEIEEDDEDEEEAPSKVLNVILGILIFVLVAVLGVIVYYILVAREIIG